MHMCTLQVINRLYIHQDETVVYVNDHHRVMGSLSSPRGILVNLVRSSVRHILEMFPNLHTSATLDTFCELFTSVPSFEPRTMQETLQKKSARVARTKQERTYEILLRTVFASEPQPLIHSCPQVVVVLLEEARRPVGVASTSERVVVPPMEEDRGRFWNIGDIGVHGAEDIHQFRLDFSIRQRFDAFRPIALLTTVRIARRLKKAKDVR